MNEVTLEQHAEPLAVVRLAPGAEVPEWAGSSSILSISATATETSVVCSAATVPVKSRHEGPFTAFSVVGPLDFALTGVLAGLLTPLAEEQISVFTLSTFDTDWVLVPADRAEQAAEAWRRTGRTVRPVQPAID
ncbi:ACT domain-containing protein [Nocardioides acrostichi]|uniref:ACT domain-containing protein n=1 Tax=Nocardioides acrostichi TaxID=2784339 RepID=A0A930YC19_9ACTN|nr:ACT domain-containing protein [Nocardioides acrostichi]MBF4163043.1 ACT domain-containing protein [Nocardioides acrostichi]